jgi:hypothetical protein
MGHPAPGNNKAYCNNIIMYLSRRVHPEIPGGDRGLIEAQMCVICEESLRGFPGLGSDCEVLFLCEFSPVICRPDSDDGYPNHCRPQPADHRREEVEIDR